LKSIFAILLEALKKQKKLKFAIVAVTLLNFISFGLGVLLAPFIGGLNFEVHEGIFIFIFAGFCDSFHLKYGL